MTDDSNEVVMLIACVLARISVGPRASDIEVTDDTPNWRHEAAAIVAALDDAGLLLKPGAGGTSEHPDLVRQVLNGDEVRRAVYSLAAAVVDARCERWREQGRAEERLKAMERKNDG